MLILNMNKILTVTQEVQDIRLVVKSVKKNVLVRAL